VRNQLTQLGLDWDSPPYRPAERSPESPVSLVVEVVDEKEYRRQGVEHAAAGRWREAHQQLSKARQFGTQDLLVWLFDATSLLAAEDHPAYQALCVELLGGTQNERNATLQSGIAQILSIGPEAVPEGSWKHVRRFAEEAAAAAPNDPAHDDHLGAVCYRSGDYAGAIEYLERAIEKKNQGKSSAIAAAGRAWTEVFLAMAHYKNGNQFEAQKWLRFATQRVANEAQPGQSWFDRKINQLLLEEMRALLGVTQAEQFARIGAGKCQQEKWSEALPDFRRARDSNPFNPQHWLQEAAVLTAMDDAAGYNELCEEMLDFFENQDRIYLRTLVRAATLAPNSISKSDWMNLRSLAEQETLSPSGVDAALGEEVLGAICYRAGDFPAAVQHLKRSVDHWSEVVQANESARGCLTAELYLAMAHCRLNEPEEAARQLAAAEEYIERDWVDRAFRKGVKKEAKQLVEQATRSIDPP
jgi:tetratricopeptide (TPR) repeat protein